MGIAKEFPNSSILVEMFDKSYVLSTQENEMAPAKATMHGLMNLNFFIRMFLVKCLVVGYGKYNITNVNDCRY